MSERVGLLTELIDFRFGLGLHGTTPTAEAGFRLVYGNSVGAHDPFSLGLVGVVVS